MKELIVRTISGILYVSILIFAMFTSRELFLGLFFLLGILTLNEYQKLIHHKGFFWYVILGIFLYFLSYDILDKRIVYGYCVLASMVNLMLLKDLFAASDKKLFDAQKFIPILFYLIAGFVFLTLIPQRENGFNAHVLIGVFALIWANDSCAYLVGKNMGKRKLMERISPKKTVEGFLGGLTGAVIASFIIFRYTQLYSVFLWLGLAILTSLLGTYGDLIQSKFKRQAAVKDSGVLIPGHGGIYDRLDSILYSSPFIYAVLELVDYVS